MKLNFRLLAPLVYLLLSTLPLQGQQITVQVEAGKQTALSNDDIQALPHIKVTAAAKEGPVTYEGVSLKAVLEKAGVEFGSSLRGKRMASCLLVGAADDYHVVIALPEIDPDFADKQIVVAFLRDGKPLDQKEGPYRIVIPAEKRPARWVRQVTTLKIVDVQ